MILSLLASIKKENQEAYDILIEKTGLTEAETAHWEKKCRKRCICQEKKAQDFWNSLKDISSLIM